MLTVQLQLKLISYILIHRGCSQQMVHLHMVVQLPSLSRFWLPCPLETCHYLSLGRKREKWEWLRVKRYTYFLNSWSGNDIHHCWYVFLLCVKILIFKICHFFIIYIKYKRIFSFSFFFFFVVWQHFNLQSKDVMAYMFMSSFLFKSIYWNLNIQGAGIKR